MVCHKLDGARLGIYYWFFCVVTVLSLAGAVSWLSLTPRNPSFRISGEQFSTLDFKNSSNSNHRNVSLSNSSLLFDLEIFNPNKRMGIYYSGIHLELYINDVLVGTNSTPAFYQGYKNTTLLHMLLHPRQEFGEAMNDGKVDFRIRVQTSIRFWIIKWKTMVHTIEYEEQFSKVKSNLNGTVSGGNYAELQNASKVNRKLKFF